MRDIKFRFIFKYGSFFRTKYTKLDELLDSNFALESMKEDINAESDICTDEDYPEYEVFKCQYTGLKDKNGVEIYEGDILEFKAPLFEKKPSPNPKCIGTTKELARIETTSGGFVFVRKFWWDDPFYPEMGDALADMQTKIWIQENCIVIGNIYENPELLEEK